MQLNDNELRKGKRIGVTISFNNHRLFVGNIPKNRDREELLEEFTKHARKSPRPPLPADANNTVQYSTCKVRMKGKGEKIPMLLCCGCLWAKFFYVFFF